VRGCQLESWNVCRLESEGPAARQSPSLSRHMNEILTEEEVVARAG